MRFKWFASLSLAVVLWATSCVLAAEEEAVFKSGLQAGDRVATSFKCSSIAGPHEGKPLCYV